MPRLYVLDLSEEVLKACKTAGPDQTQDSRRSAIDYIKLQKMLPQNLWLSAVLQLFDVQKKLKGVVESFGTFMAPNFVKLKTNVSNCPLLYI